MNRKIALFASGDVGVSVAKYLLSKGDDVVALFLAGQYPKLDQEILDQFSQSQVMYVGTGDSRGNLQETQERLRELEVDTILTVYWPFILPSEVFETAEISVNFHPALLPLNRGWYPHVHNIIDGSPAGVTLHKLSSGADEGDIWVQKEVELHPWDLASDIHKRLQGEITKLFIENWPQIKDNRIQAKPQRTDIKSYHSKKEIEHLDKIELDKTYTGAQLINILRARTFGDRGFAYFDSPEGKVFIKVKLERE